jgi:hypothetical protein
MEPVMTGQSLRRPVTDEERAHRAGKRRADLRQAIWEASQSMGTDEIADFVGGVLCEIDTDAP